LPKLIGKIFSWSQFYNNEYVEEKLFTIKPGELTGVRGIHHISQEKNFFILDACYHKR